MAGRASLAFLGQEDLALSADPEVTYFIEKYEGQTQYANRLDRVQFENGYVNFGQENIILVPKSGDLITDMYLKLIWPNITQGNGNPASVLDSVGTLMIDFIELYIGDLLIQRIYGEFLELKFDLEVPNGKQGTLAGLVGKTIQNAPYTLPGTSYTIPLQFSCLENGLPICAFDDPVWFRIQFMPSPFFTIDTDTFQGVNYNRPVEAYLDVEYTYVSDDHVRFIKSKPQLHLFEQTQRQHFWAPAGINTFQCLLNFVNPVKEMYFVIQNNSARGYDYSNTANASTISNLYFGTSEQLVTMALYFNSTERISPDVGTPVFLNTIQSLEFHSRNPDRLFYMYSFCLDPENREPTGSVNMSMIKNQILQLALNPSTDAREIRVFAVSYNFLRFENGKVILEFPNAETA